MTTTPEQLAKWREDFESPLIKEDLIRDSEYPADYQDREIEANWVGYLRRCQETEQAIKDARKRALKDVLSLANDEQTNYCNYDFFEFRQSIERLLK